jgi:hypothetical protein
MAAKKEERNKKESGNLFTSRLQKRDLYEYSKLERRLCGKH